MRVLDFLKPILEDFFRFAKEVDKEFLSYIEREELYEGLKKAQELKEKQHEPLKKLYCEWVEKSFKFLIDRWVCFEEFPSESFLLTSGLKGSKKLSFWAMLTIREEDAKSLTEEEFELSKYISENLDELYVYKFVNALATWSLFRGGCGNYEINISPVRAVRIFEVDSYDLLYNDSLMIIPNTLKLRHIYNEFFEEHHATFSRILSDRLSQAIEEGLPEKHIRVIQTAIAVIKEDPESLPKGEPKSFAEKWLREELVEW
ncbi:MAG: hypothetical protein ACO2PP_12255 [Thermocrinis sp.]|mgnify:CR=1 FL=1|jgi:hypothetical protein|uniref:hypothetical protein n=1 Tax=Thermocrinis sp. TaxID=2024383 RepID=UPI003C09F149